MNAPLHPTSRSIAALAYDPRPKSAVSTMTGVVGLAGLFAWTAVARALRDGRAAGGADRARSPAACRWCLWSLLVDKVHRNPTTGIDWDSPPRPLKESADISLAKIAGLWGIWAVIGGALLHRPLVLGRAPISSRCTCSAAAIVPMLVLSVPYVLWLDRRLKEPQGRRLAFRPAADRPRRPRRPDRAPPFLPRLGGQGLLPRLHDLDRARQLVGGDPRRIAAGSPPIRSTLAIWLIARHVHGRRDLRDRRLRADDEAARRPYPHRQSLCGGLDGGLDLLSALHPDGRRRAARLSWRPARSWTYWLADYPLVDGADRAPGWSS